MDKREIETVWRQYKETKDSKCKEEIISHYVQLVKLVAGRLSIYLNQYIETDDLVEYGILGLIDAIDKFDFDKNVKFETYASLRIRGSILDAIRKLDWMPRTLRKKQKEIDRAYLTLEMKLSRAPREEEMAEFLEISLENYRQLLKDINISALVSIDENSYYTECLSDKTSLLPDESIEKKESYDLLAQVISQLPEREKMVVTLYYYEELTLKEISKVLEVSESRVSQLHTKAISRLRTYMEKEHFSLSL